MRPNDKSKDADVDRGHDRRSVSIGAVRASHSAKRRARVGKADAALRSSREAPLDESVDGVKRARF